ncbi:hypothetical protein KR067_009707 [Drosophila pandora]|nr:hypothetical protein KR067_009707 [Drosophila pandora]
MKNRKIRDFAQPEEDSLESIANSSSDGTRATVTANTTVSATASASAPAPRSRPRTFRMAGQSSLESGNGTEQLFLQEQQEQQGQQQHEAEVHPMKVEAEPPMLGNPGSIIFGGAEQLLKKHHQQQQQQHPDQQQPIDQDQVSGAEGQGSAATAGADTGGGAGTGTGSGAGAEADAGAGAAVDTEKKRCDKCGKKLGLTGGFPCRCGGTFCAFHRYSDRHECNFDYREMGASEIRRDNPVIVASKLRKL